MPSRCSSYWLLPCVSVPYSLFFHAVRIKGKHPSLDAFRGAQDAVARSFSFRFHDRTAKSGPIETDLALDAFPSPETLWEKYKAANGITPAIEPVVAQEYFADSTGRAPRYYQQIAINRTVKAIAKDEGNNRHLLVMATGTGKTYTAFQIIYRLWKSGLKKRILFLADRTALVDQTVRGDFRHFKDAMTVIKHKQIDTAYNIYLSLYQGLSDNKNGDNDAYKQFSPDFFDLVIVDECHRGSAREDSKWREILEYFNSATHIGLTATPKETREVSSSEYFGDPLFTYSLKQGIDDGFLAPYKVIKVTLDIDAEGWRPPKGFKDKDGNDVEDRIYNRTDFDKLLVVEERRQLVAQKITEFLKGSDRFSKTIVFCVDIEHAEGMRKALANANADLVAANSKYVMQITGDNEEGKRYLDAFISPTELYPVIATTSKLMTTGVDAQTCKLIVLDSNIGSMTEFKQIIGRGTRINEDFGKHYFTIMDFRNVTALFADKEFDGEPDRVKVASEDDDLSGTDAEVDDTPVIDEPTGMEILYPESDPPDVTIKEGPGEYAKRRKITVNGVEVTIIKNVRNIMRRGSGHLRRCPAPGAARLDALPQNHGRQGPGTRAHPRRLYLRHPREIPVAHLGDRSRGHHRRGADRLYRPPHRRPLRQPQELQSPKAPQRAAIVREVFDGLNNYMKSGYAMRKVINQLNGFDFNNSEDRHIFGTIYESILIELRDAGNKGEYYTPRAITQLMTQMTAPKLGDKVLDPAAGTGGFLSAAIDYIREHEVRTLDDEAILQKSITGWEYKPVAYVLGLTNLILHGIDVPDYHYQDSLKTEYNGIGPRQQVDVILANPPFGARHRRWRRDQLPASFRCRESADLFVILMIQLLKPGGRCAIVLPDGCITGDGYKERIREKLLTDCNLHTIVRLPQSTFHPATVSTNLLFFQKGSPTNEIWYYEHRLPEGQKSYSKTKAIQFDEFTPMIEWWDNREENEVAWKIKVSDLKKGFDLDVKNPHREEEEADLSALEITDKLFASMERSRGILAQLKEGLK
jgi:type I restriction-modification system DNA methylase subunit/superfamily II DNA or RNA helicase